jgi:hypothetical protein
MVGGIWGYATMDKEGRRYLTLWFLLWSSLSVLHLLLSSLHLFPSLWAFFSFLPCIHFPTLPCSDAFSFAAGGYWIQPYSGQTLPSEFAVFMARMSCKMPTFWVALFLWVTNTEIQEVLWVGSCSGLVRGRGVRDTLPSTGYVLLGITALPAKESQKPGFSLGLY